MAESDGDGATAVEASDDVDAAWAGGPLIRAAAVASLLPVRVAPSERNCCGARAPVVGGVMAVAPSIGEGAFGVALQSGNCERRGAERSARMRPRRSLRRRKRSGQLWRTMNRGSSSVWFFR